MTVLKNRVGSPGTVYLAMEPCNRVIPFFIPGYEVLDLFGMLMVADEKSICRIHHHKIIHANQSDVFARGINIVILRRYVVRSSGIALFIMGGNIIECPKCAQITPVGFKRHDGDVF